jgi:pyruvate dehydrogenase E2 component (dihydrolipoamide acetyltransferase)
MPSTVLMPALSPTMTQGYLVKWHKDVGQSVRSGDVLMEVETDKAIMEVEATQEGILDHILIEASSQTMVQVGQVVAILRNADEPQGIGQTHPACQEARPDQTEAGPAAAHPQPKQLDPSPVDSPCMPALPSHPSDAGRATQNEQPLGPSAQKRILVSPLARSLAQRRGIDLAGLMGSGPGGRIVKRDVDKANPASRGWVGESLHSGSAANASASPACSTADFGRPAGQLTSPDGPKGAEPSWTLAPISVGQGAVATPSLLPISGMRRVIAQRLTQSKQTVPHFTLTVPCVMDELLALRSKINSQEKRFSVNDFLVRACALALWDTPEMRTLWTEDTLVRHNTIDLAVAVSVPGGLLTPIVAQAEGKPLALLAPEIKDLAARARAGTLPASAYQGGTFTLSNLGMHGIESFTPIINPPQSGILAIGNTTAQPWVDDNGQLCVRHVLRASVAADHRSVDGQDAARFLTRFQSYVQNPHLLLS